MIEYCMVIYLNCKDIACYNEIKKRQEMYEKSKLPNSGWTYLPVRVLQLNSYPFKTKDLCNSAFINSLAESKEKVLTYSHVCYTVNIKKYSNCFGYKDAYLTGGYGVSR